MNDDAHSFPLAGEGDRRHNLWGLAGFLPILSTEVLGKLKRAVLVLDPMEVSCSVSGSISSKVVGSIVIDWLRGK